MGDAHILQMMHEDRMEELRFLEMEFDRGRAYDECLDECDKRNKRSYEAITTIIYELAAEYNVTPADILSEMVIPTLEAEVLHV